MHTIWISLLLCLVASAAWAQKPVTVEAAYTYHAPENVTLEQAKATALERAQVQAIADEFGTLMGQSNATVITNDKGKSDVRFSSVGHSNVNGEWVETLDQPRYDINYEEGMLVVSVKVKGRIRKLTSPKIDLAVNLLRNGTDLKYESTDFHNGDDMYLHFLSPVSGHLLVYLVDHTAQQAYCLLPYSQQADAAQPIEQGRDYLFFSAQSVPADQRAVVDEYTLTTDKTMEQNEVVVVFSTDELVKANTSASIGQLPRAMEVDHFNKWLSALRTTNQKTQIIYKPITLKK